MSKEYLDKIFKQLNNWDSQLIFTVVKMEENRLIFLDSEIFIFENKIQFKHYRGIWPENSSVELQKLKND